MAVNGKIDSIANDFTPKGLGELQAFLEPWLKGRTRGISQGAAGIQFGIHNLGSFLDIETTGNITLDAHGHLVLKDIPTSNPGGSLNVWADNGVLVLSGAGHYTLPIGIWLVFEYLVPTPVSSIDLGGLNVLLGYSGLMIDATYSGTGAGVQDDRMQFNSDTAAHYRWSYNYNAGNTPASAWDGAALTTSAFVGRVPQTSADTQLPAVSRVIIPDSYGSLRKTYMGQYGIYNTEARAGVTSGGWNQTAAINEIKRSISFGNFDVGSSFRFYGLKKSLP